ncbi:hypothetical protein V6N13_091721 [Hibiscus sabdariffa]
MPVLDQMLKEQLEENKIPVFCPALTNGSLGDMLYFHSFRSPNLIVNLVQDVRAMNCEAVLATGMIILGGGLPKHHICNANMMCNGADYDVYINTAQEYDGSDSGARPDEAVSWGKFEAMLKQLRNICFEVEMVHGLVRSLLSHSA